MQALFLAALGIGLIVINLNILGAVLLISALVVMTSGGETNGRAN